MAEQLDRGVRPLHAGGIGAAPGPLSHLWFSIDRGVVNGIYYPRLDMPIAGEIRFMVTGPDGYVSEDPGDTSSETSVLAPGCPVFLAGSHAPQYRIDKEVLADPRRSTLLQLVRFTALDGRLEDYHLYIVAMSAACPGGVAHAAAGTYNGTPVLVCRQENGALALTCSSPFLAMAAGSGGIADAIRRRAFAPCEGETSGPGPLALAAEVDISATNGTFLMAVGCGPTPDEAAFCARASLGDGFTEAENRCLKEWKVWQSTLDPQPRLSARDRDLYHISGAVLRMHEQKTVPGAVLPGGAAGCEAGAASVWIEDLAAAGAGFLAAGAIRDAYRIIHYLQVTQHADGHWPQSMSPGGDARLDCGRLDETALALLLVDLARREKAINEADVSRLWPMMKRGASYLMRNGPAGPGDRREEDPGYSPATLAREIAALLAAADFAEMNGDPAVAGHLRETADAWNDGIERWTFVRYRVPEEAVGVSGYYVETVPSPAAHLPPGGRRARIVPHPEDAAYGVSTDVLELVRLGLRAPDDPRIEDTVKVIDAVLRVELPQGPFWRRFTGDIYGESVDGQESQRVWPVLGAERALYELAAGRRDAAERLRDTVASSARGSGMIPEQVPGPGEADRGELLPGWPLVRAHAAYLVLLRSLQDGGVFVRPPQTAERYLDLQTPPKHTLWRFNNRCATAPAGRLLRIETLVPAVIRWSADGWKTARESNTRNSGAGTYAADLSTGTLTAGTAVEFTFYWPSANRWEGRNFAVRIGEPETVRVEPARFLR